MVPDFLTIAEAGALIAKRELSPVDLVQSRLARIERFDGELHSFIRVLPRRQSPRPRSAEAEIMAGYCRGPLHGIPIGLKDIYETKGVPTTGPFESDDRSCAATGRDLGPAPDRGRGHRHRQARDP